MADYVSKGALKAPRLEEDDVEIPDVGIVRVRGLNRIEAVLVAEVDGTARRERKILRHGLVNPKMSEAEIEQWQMQAPGGELEPVVRRITELSGLADGSSKSGVPRARGERGAGVRALPSDGARDDGGAASAGAV